MTGRKTLAVWLHGGIGTGHFSQGFAVLDRVISGLTKEFDVVVYSQHAPNPGFVHPMLKIQSPPASIRSGWARWLFLLRSFRSDHQDKKFTLVFACWGYPAGLLAVGLAKYFNIPSVVYLLGSDSAGIKKIDFGVFHRPLLRTVVLWTYRKASRLIVLTNFQANHLRAQGVDRPVAVVPWGIDPSDFHILQKDPAPVLRLLQVAHLNPVKDQPMLLKAFATILKSRAATLRIIGYDSLGGEIQSLARVMNMSTHIEFLPMVEHGQMIDHYHWADIFVQSSMFEGQGMAATEAAACGVLLAGTRVGFMADIGEEGAVLADVGDHEMLASRILAIAEQPAAWRSKIAKAADWVRHYPFEKTVSDLIRILKDVTPENA